MSEETGIHRYEIVPPGAGGQKLPFSKAVRAGDFVYVSGQVAMLDGEIIDGGIVKQTHKTMQNVIAILAEAGCGIEHVVKVNCWLDDPRDFWSFNGVFEKYFHEHPPARSTVQSAIMVDAKVEIDVIAYKPLTNT
jgi:reactive intermediate/imine deaminase